jgi:putative FmdB family regulatory protein
MPIYEFYCPDCHVLFSFLSRVPAARKRPACPRCGRARIERRASAFAVSRRGGGDPGQEAGAAPDEARLERALSEMAHGLEGTEGQDPRRMAGALRGVLSRTGLRLGPGMEEALARLEAGEDPEHIDRDLGQDAGGDSESGDEESWLSLAPERAARSRRSHDRPPRVDDRLYEL